MRRYSTRAVVLGVAAVAATAVFSALAARGASPEHVALEYGRAVYANDADALWPLISEEDRRVKDQATFRRQQHELRGLARGAVRQLARYIDATPVRTSIEGPRARVTLRFRLPDANAPAIRALMHDWDEARLQAVPAAERDRILARIVALHDGRQIPVVEGEETFDLVREIDRWKISLHWSDGVRVQFRADVDSAVPLTVSVTPPHAAMSPGERLRVTVRATNSSGREVTTRVGHRIEPPSDSRYLALLLCPLLVPVTLAPGETREFTSEYLLLADTPPSLRALDVTYLFPARTARSR